MKKDLTNHVKEILLSLGGIVPFEVFDCNNDNLPGWVKEIQPTHEYIICCQDLSLKHRLKLFTGKNIFESGNNLYWFEGEMIVKTECLPHSGYEKSGEKKTEYLKTDTRLPAYIDDFIFNHLQAVYAPDFQRFEYNLDLTGEEIRKYLGTYFPRSYAESFCIFDNIFQNDVYQETITSKKSLNILSVGCGTGGDILGLLTAIEKYFHFVLEINVLAIDGNNEALTFLEQIIDRTKNHTSKTINLKTRQTVFSSISDFLIENVVDKSFDFILSFKVICEIISMGKGKFDNSYYDFVMKFLPLLSENGIFILLDVTTKPKHTTYNPILMNKQVNQAIRELGEYKTLTPAPCSVYSEICFCNCFQQKTFTVTHSKYSNDKSRVAYRVLVSKQLKERLRRNVNNTKQLINNDKHCPYTDNGDKQADAFLL